METPLVTKLARTLATDIAATTASPIANVLIVFILCFVCSLFLTLAESDFWLDVQARTLSFTRLSYCCLLFIVNTAESTLPIVTEETMCFYPILGHVCSQSGH